MKKFLLFLMVSVFTVSAFARGGSSSTSSSGGSRGGSYSGARSYSTPSYSAPRSYSTPSYSTPRNSSTPSYSTTTPRSSTTTTTTTTRRSSNYSSGYGGGYGGGYMPYGGFGMGYGYTNGILTGLIIGNLMHPTGTVMYGGPGVYNNNALLYPDGRVVDQSGRAVGMYNNGQFTPIQNGDIVAQPAPQDAMPPRYTAPQPAPVVIQQHSEMEFFLWLIGILTLVFVIVWIIV